MHRLSLFVILFLFCICAHCIDDDKRQDGFFVVHAMETEYEDVKCDIGVTADYVKSIMNKGRHVMSVAPTKFGLVVVHRKAESDMPQQYVHIPPYDFKREAKKFFKKGYVVENYNQSSHAVLTKDPSITKQTYMEGLNQKKVARKNKKGVYVNLGASYEKFGHNNMKGVTSQEYRFYLNERQMLNDFKEMASKGYIVGSVEVSYNKYSDSSFYTIIYDKPQKDYKEKHFLGVYETKEGLQEFIKKYVNDKYKITGIWGGWENRNYAREAAFSAAANEESALDVFLGLGNSVLQLTDAIKSPSSNTSNTYTNSSNSSNSAHSSRAKAQTGKCKYCGGTGTCSPTSSAGRKNACHGSGLCGYCSGTGWIKAGASESKCMACNGNKKCKSCKGSGKCKHCNGTGK